MFGVDWFTLFGIVLQLWSRLRAYKGRTIRTLLVIEGPEKQLSVEEAQARLADTGATVLPGFTITV